MKSHIFPRISYSDWREEVDSQLGDNDVGLESTVETIPIEALYTADHPTPLQEPAPPSDRAVDRAVKQEELSWFPCQSYSSSDLETFNHHLRSDLDGGARGVWIRLDRTARRADDPTSSPQVGADGAPLYRLSDFEMALRGSRSDWGVLALDGGGAFLSSAAILSRWLAEAPRETEDQTVLYGADPLGSLALEGRLPGRLDSVMGDLALLIGHSRDQAGSTRALGVSTIAYREAGATPDLELAIAAASAIEYLRWLEKSGVAVDAVAAEIAFTTSIGQQIFLEIAKLRALRLVWAHVLQQFDVGDTAPPWIHASVLRRSLQSREPASNQLRTTAAGWAAILGGVDSLEIPTYDYFDGAGGSVRGRRLARNLQLILGLEARLDRVRDPAKGSYLLERLTATLVDRSWSLLQEIESRGGLLESLRTGWLQKSIEERWEDRKQRIARGEIKIIGVNAFPEPDPRTGEQSESPHREIRDAIRHRYSEQQPPSALAPPTDRDQRWTWCLEAAASNRSIAEMNRALYPAEPDFEIVPVRAHRDSEGCEDEGAVR